MSVAVDTVRLINEEIPAFSLLPAVNYFYIYWECQSPDTWTKGMVLAAFFFSAVGFNILSRVDFKAYIRTRSSREQSKKYNSKDDYILGIRSIAIIMSSAICWLFVFSNSLLELSTLFGKGPVWPELLFAISTLIISVVISDILLSIFLPVYEE